MEISLTGAGKKFNRSWIFRNLNYTFENSSYAILGSNGSGKTTLLQVISGFTGLSQGQIKYSKEGSSISGENIFSSISFASPYLEIPEELTLTEMLIFHSRFKEPLFSISEIADKLMLANHKEKEIKTFSSGMKQRLKLGLSLFYKSDLILLDEPTTHLDESGVEWYLENVQKYSEGKCLIVASNQEREYGFCKSSVRIEDFKPQLKMAV